MIERVLCCAAALCLALVSPAVAHPRLNGRAPALPPFAWATFCGKAPMQCARHGRATTVGLSGGRRAELVRVNEEVNGAIAYAADAGGDRWQTGVREGDCEDYALTKRQRLLAAGWPSGALRIATARTSGGAAHAVLVVSTSDGDLVLDNRFDRIARWDRVSLRWLKIQSRHDPMQWERF